MTEQSIVLLFTLGMLAGLPAGYALGCVVDHAIVAVRVLLAMWSADAALKSILGLELAWHMAMDGERP